MEKVGIIKRFCVCDGQHGVRTGEGGARQSQLVNWYLKEIEAELDSVEEVKSKKLLVEKIVERLVQRVSAVALFQGGGRV